MSLFRRILNSKLNHQEKKKEDRERKEEASHFSIFNQLFPLPFECGAMPNFVMGLGHHPSRATHLQRTGGRLKAEVREGCEKGPCGVGGWMTTLYQVVVAVKRWDRVEVDHSRALFSTLLETAWEWGEQPFAWHQPDHLLCLGPPCNISLKQGSEAESVWRLFCIGLESEPQSYVGWGHPLPTEVCGSCGYGK